MVRTEKSAKTRLDSLLVARGLAPNRTRARALVLAGIVYSGAARLGISIRSCDGRP